MLEHKPSKYNNILVDNEFDDVKDEDLPDDDDEGTECS